MATPMPSMPSFEQLHNAVGQDWHLRDLALNVEPARIVSVQAVPPMSAQHTAYRLVLELPANRRGEQGAYLLEAPDGQVWPLFFSPAASSATGQARLQASFHYLAL